VTIRVVLPYHLRNLAKTGPDEIPLEVAPSAGAGAPVTLRDVLDALEVRYPVLRGTIRDHATKVRRPFLRFYACQEDLSNESPDTPLPKAVVSGEEPLLVVGAMAGG
jgi:sulfur-carrier protein